jgi:D-3-phosphoglycerate dehydrogenase
MLRDGVKPVKSAGELYKTCQVVSLHIPLTADTRASIGKDLLTAMPANPLLINTARKEVVNEAELLEMFARRTDIRYVTDIRPDNHTLLAEQYGDRYFSTPKKTGAQTAEANINAGLAAARQIVDFFATGNQRFRVNK